MRVLETRGAQTTGPLIVQGDHSLLLEVEHEQYAEARDSISRFAHLEKSPEYLHTYRITPLSVWNACATDCSPEEMLATLERFSRYPVPTHIARDLDELARRYGRLKIVRQGEELLLEVDGQSLANEVWSRKEIRAHLLSRQGARAFVLQSGERGRLKQALIRAGFPADDQAGYSPGEGLPFSLRKRLATSGEPFALRAYQREAVAIFHAGGSARGGSGVVVLPCGAGKTIVGIGVLAELQMSAVIVTTSITAVRQWIDELLDKTDLEPEQVAEYTGERKDLKPITVTTYQTLTYRPKKDGPFPHCQIFEQKPWGLIVYDEVHLLPAPVFQVTADLQARRRLGLTATLVREDGRQDDVFALIGPKKYDVPWKDMERQGWIARAHCTEVRVKVEQELRLQMAEVGSRAAFRLAAENPAKMPMLERLLERHSDEPALVIGMYIEQLRAIAKSLGAPLLTGQTTQRRREQLYRDFRAGRLPVLVVSKVANFAIDLPDASLAVQVSGTFGSRQEEAQRLGRILRPKAGANHAYFYTIVSADSVEQDFAMRRQLYLCEQGYAYSIVDAEEP